MRLRNLKTLRGMVVVLTSLALTDVKANDSDLDRPALEEVIAEIEATHVTAKRLLDELPRDRFDPQEILEQKSFDAVAIVEWVRNETQWVPYRGALRGPLGVLHDRRGNSLDRALLLATLFADAGYDVRLARMELPAEQIRRLKERHRASTYAPGPVDHGGSKRAAFVAERTVNQADALLDIVTLPDDPWTSGIDSAIEDHWFVEARTDSAWRRFDPGLGVLGTVDEAEPVARVSLDDVPGDLFHEVTIRVVIERWADGAVHEELPLETSVRMADALYHDLEVQFVPFDFDEAPPGADARTELDTVVDTATAWLPVVRTRDRRFLDEGFDVEGNLERNLGAFAAQRKLSLGTEKLAGMNRRDEKARSLLSAAWIEYDIVIPGRPRYIVRREIFDLPGPARRRSGDLADFAIDADGIRHRGLALTGVTRVLLTSGQVSPIAWRKASLEYWAHQGPQIAALVRAMADPSDEDVLQRLHGEPMVALELLTLAMLRGELSRHKSALFQAGPNVLASHYLRYERDDAGVSRAFDLVYNEVGVVSSGSMPAAQLRLEQGVLDTVLELELLAVPTIINNTADLFSRRDTVTGPWTVLDKPGTTRLDAVAQARIANAIASGSAIVAPRQVSEGYKPAWWQIDPLTGTTLGIGYKGWGQSASGEDLPVRGIATGGFKEGTRRYGVEVSCQVVLAHLMAQGMPVQMVPGPRGPAPLITPNLQRWLRSYGCSWT